MDMQMNMQRHVFMKVEKIANDWREQYCVVQLKAVKRVNHKKLSSQGKKYVTI